MHPFIQGKALEEFIPNPSNFYLEVQKNPSVPSGALRGSCPSLLQRIRGSQDQTVRAQDVCFRPLVEDLKDDFFTGFVHGKLVQVQQPPPNQPMPKTQWTNPFMNIPITLKSNNAIPTIPLFDIIGPRYTRPHSYGEEHSQLPRPVSPMIESNKSKFNKNYRKKKPWKNNDNKARRNSTIYNEYLHKIIPEIRPNSLDDKKIISTSDKLLGIPNAIIPNNIINQSFNSKAADPSKFLDKIKKEASSTRNN